MIDRNLPSPKKNCTPIVDGELPHDRREAVESWLATHPDDMARVGAWRAQADSIRARYGAAAAEPVPARLALDRLLANERGWRSWRGIAAAAVIALTIGASGGWVARGLIVGATRRNSVAEQPAKDGFAAFTSEAIEAYKLYVVEVRHPVEVTATDADHLVQWLSKRVGYKLRAPNLEGIGSEARWRKAASGADRRSRILHVRERHRRALHALLRQDPGAGNGTALQRQRRPRRGFCRLLVERRGRLCHQRQGRPQAIEDRGRRRLRAARNAAGHESRVAGNCSAQTANILLGQNQSLSLWPSRD